MGLLSPGHTSPNREAVPQGDFPSDLTELNLTRWADLVQDTTESLQVLPPSLSLGLGPQVVALLQLLEWGSATTAVTLDLGAHVREPPSQLPLHCGARLSSRLQGME